jgi:hypothetical protein
MQLRIAGVSPDTRNEDSTPLFTKIEVVEFVSIIREVISGKSEGYAIAKPSDDLIKLSSGIY